MWKALGRGFDSRRLHHILLCLLCVCSTAFAQDVITVFEGAKKTQIQIQNIEGTPYLRVNDLQPFFQFKLSPIGPQSLSITVGPHNVILSANRTLISLDEKLISLNHPVYVAQGIWYVSFDFISKVLKVTSEKRVLWLENSRSLMLGDITPNQLVMRYSMEADHSRVVFQSVRQIGFLIAHEGNAIVLTPQSDDYLMGFDATDFNDGVIKKLALAGTGDRRSFRIELDDGFSSFKSFDLGDPPRLVIDFYRKENVESPVLEQPKEPEPAPPTLLPSTTPERRVIVIDPGHGGTETGATGKSGTFEKDITLAIAYKLKGILEASTGVRVILTRTGDQVVPLDDRTALANNNKADLFLSIHANSTVHGYAKGTETYFLSTKATDDEARRAAAVENNAIGLSEEAVPEVDPDLKLILWDMAQTEYLAESSQLAETIQQELNSTLAVTNRGIKQAPFRVLMGAMMPAVLVEVGFINNPAEEKLMTDADYQMKIARALFRSVQKFQGMNNAPIAQSQKEIR